MVDVYGFFAVCSSAVAYLRTLVSLGHSTVNISGPWGVLWQFSNKHVRRLGTTVFNSSLYIYIERERERERDREIDR